MEKALQWLYYTFLTVFLAGVVCLTAALFASPRQDALDRGFIPCTKELVYGLSGCESGRIGCPLKLLWHDMKCNIGVMYTGVADWMHGKQSTPWANYLFEPQLFAVKEENPYQGDAARDMDDVERQNRMILQKQQELEAAKHRVINIDTDVVLYNPENPSEASALPAKATDAENIGTKGDIADETNIDIIPPQTPEVTDAVAPQPKDVLKEIQNQTTEKLQKGNLKDEK